MHRMIVWSTSLLVGLVCALPVQWVAPMTIYGWLIFVGMFTVVIVPSLTTSLALRRLSIRWRHALRRWILRLRCTLRPAASTSAPARLDRMMMATFSIAAAIAVYHVIWMPDPPRAGATSPTEPAVITLSDGLTTWADHAVTASSDRVAARSDDSSQPRPLLDAARPGEIQEEGPAGSAWTWLFDLLFASSQPAA